MKVISIDPGYDRLGVAILEKENGKESLIHSECFSPSKKLSKEERMVEVGKKIKETIKKYKPGFLALEELFLNKNLKTAMAVSETKGIIIYEAILAGLKVYQYTPLQVKIAITGYGRSDKDQVTSMVKKIIPVKNKKKSTDDEYDAIAVGLTFFAHFRSQNLLSTDSGK